VFNLARFEVCYFLLALTGFPWSARLNGLFDGWFRERRIFESLRLVEDERLLSCRGLFAGPAELAKNRKIMLFSKKVYLGPKLGYFAGLGRACFT
jgi:hypothetical protein